MSLLFLLTASTAIVFLTGPVISLGSLCAPASSLFTSLSGQHQQVRGRFYLTPGMWTTLEVADAAFAVRDKHGFKGEGEIASGRLSVHFWSLLSGKLRFDGISLADMSLRLAPSPERTVTAEPLAKEDGKGVRLKPFLPIETGLIRLKNITVSRPLPDQSATQTLTIDHAEGEFGRHAAGRFELLAALDDREVHLEIAAAPLENLTMDDKAWDFTTTLSYLSSTARIQGAVSSAGEEPVFSAEAVLSGSRFNDVTALFGQQSSKNLPFSLRAAVELSPGHLQARLFELKPGSEQLDARITINGNHWQTAKYFVNLKGARLDLDALKGLAGRSDSVGPSARKAEISREDRLVPEDLPLENLAISLDIEELIIGGRRVSGISFAGEMRNRQVKEAPFHVRFKNSEVSGDLTFDFTGDTTVFSAHSKATAINAGAMLQELGFVQGLSMHFDRVLTELNSRGRTVGELIDNLSFTVHSAGGHYVYLDPNTGSELSIVLHDSSVTLIPEQALSIDLKGQIRGVPISIGLRVEDLRGRKSEENISLPVTIEIQSEDTLGELRGDLPLPISLDKASLRYRLRGKSFSSLNDLFLVRLPDIGPYELAGTFGRRDDGYYLDEMSVMIGSSSLHGRFYLDTTASPPRVSIELNSPRVQLYDFKTSWARTNEPSAEGRGAGQGFESNMQRLSDQRVLDTYDLVAEVEVKEVMSGEDFLGSGLARIEQKGGRLTISPLTLQMSGGTVALDFSVAPSAETQKRLYRLDIQVQDFNYGIIARFLRPDTDMSGILDLQTSLAGHSSDFRSLMANASGTVNLLIRPQKMRSGIFDLWAINLLSFLTSFFTAESESKVNCFSGRFQIHDGILHQDDLLIDTSRIQVRGDLEIDFHQQSVNAYLRPIPKRPRFFNLGTPVRISGRFDDIGVGLPAMGIAGTIVRLATSYIAVPIQWLILNQLPEDGTGACLDMIKPGSAEP